MYASNNKASKYMKQNGKFKKEITTVGSFNRLGIVTDRMNSNYKKLTNKTHTITWKALPTNLT